QDQRTDQALVTVCYLARARPAREAREHRIGRALDGAAADQGADRDDTIAAALDHGPDLPDREDRADADERVARRDRDQLGRLERLEHARRRPRLRGALVEDLVRTIRSEEHTSELQSP